jgi:hypothetical protein
MKREDKLIGDKGNNNQDIEDRLKEGGINFRSLGDKRSKRHESEDEEKEKSCKKEKIEILEVCLKSIYFGGKVRVISFTGFVLKILMAIFSYDISRLIKVATVSYH